MKNRIIIILTLLFCGITLNAQTDSTQTKLYTLKGKLVTEFDNLTPECGILAWATIVEFEVIDLSDSEYSKKKIPIIFTCPSSNITKEFKVGEIYELILTDKNQSDFEYTMLESQQDILTKYKLNKEYWFIEKKE